MPKFYVLTIDELPGVFFCGLVVGAYKPDCAADMTILVKDERAIFGHLRSPNHRQFIDHRKSFWSVRFRTRNRIMPWCDIDAPGRWLAFVPTTHKRPPGIKLYTVKI